MNRNKLNYQELPLKVTIASPFDTSSLAKVSSLPIGHLLLLVPSDSNYHAVIPRIWELASATGRSVQILSLCKYSAQALSLRRQLIIMSALVNASRISPEAKVEIGSSWIDAVRKNYQPGDIIVCFAEHSEGFLEKPLNQILELSFHAPIFILSGLYPQRSSKLNMLSPILLWVGLISIIAGAFLLQVRIMSLPGDWIQTVLMIFVVFGEMWLIYAWNNLFS